MLAKGAKTYKLIAWCMTLTHVPFCCHSDLWGSTVRCCRESDLQHTHKIKQGTYQPKVLQPLSAASSHAVHRHTTAWWGHLVVGCCLHSQGRRCAGRMDGCHPSSGLQQPSCPWAPDHDALRNTVVPVRQLVAASSSDFCTQHCTKPPEYVMHRTERWHGWAMHTTIC